MNTTGCAEKAHTYLASVTTSSWDQVREARKSTLALRRRRNQLGRQRQSLWETTLTRPAWHCSAWDCLSCAYYTRVRPLEHGERRPLLIHKLKNNITQTFIFIFAFVFLFPVHVSILGWSCTNIVMDAHTLMLLLTEPVVAAIADGNKVTVSSSTKRQLVYKLNSP